MILIPEVVPSNQVIWYQYAILGEQQILSSGTWHNQGVMQCQFIVDKAEQGLHMTG